MQRSFTRLRDDIIRNLVRTNEIAIQDLLKSQRDEIILNDYEAIIHNSYVIVGDAPFEYYLSDRDLLLPRSLWLFPTFQGKLYQYSKYRKNQSKYQLKAGLPSKFVHPNDLSDIDEISLRQSSFSYYRHSYQIRLAAILCSRLGFRSSELTILEKQHLDFGNIKIYLSATKSQQPQELPMLSDLIEPLKLLANFLRNPDDPLFVRSNGSIWTRKHVLRAVSWWGELQGLERRVTPRILRATLGSRLAKRGFPIRYIAMLLRHKDEATTLRHYTEQEFEDFHQALEEIGDDFTS